MTVFKSSPIFQLMIVAASLTLCLLLHWLIGKLRNRLLQKMESAVAETEAASTLPQATLRKLYIEWAAKAVRTFIWLSFVVLTLQLLPTVQADILEASKRLKELLSRSLHWLLGNGLSALIVIIVTIFLMRFVAAIIRTAFNIYESRVALGQDDTLQRRSQTLSAIFRGIVQSMILFVGLMVALQQAGLNITPILASAGILGLAIGFGAQSLIKDLFSGFMILFEEQYSVGDTIRIGDVTGAVESLTLRSTRVRALDGALTMFPNGSINTVANLSKDWMRVVLDFEVDYSADVDQAIAIMSDVAIKLYEEREGELLEEPAAQGLDKVVNGNLTLRLVCKALPAKNAELSRELRRRIKIAFDKADIKGPARVGL